jgi:hypothetical protein
LLIRALIALTVVIPVSFDVSVGAAAVIYDNNVTPDRGMTSDPSSIIIKAAADDFVLNAGANTVTDVHWTGIYLPADTPGTDAFTVTFYADSSGLPGNSLAVFNVGSAVNRTDTGTDVSGSDLFSYSIDIPALTLTPDVRYWISVTNDTTSDLDDEWRWGAIFVPFIDSAFFIAPAWSRNDFEVDFSLTGPAVVPEPSSALLSMLGVVVAALAARRRSCRKTKSPR